jgi:hypothetical protein
MCLSRSGLVVAEPVIDGDDREPLGVVGYKDADGADIAARSRPTNHHH